jgi:hypothetical protein
MSVFTCQNGLLFLFFCPLFSVGSLSFTLAHNVFGLGEGGELEVQMFILAQMLIRIPNAQI